MGLKTSQNVHFRHFFSSIFVATQFFYRDRFFSVMIENFVMTEFSLARQSFSLAIENFVAIEFLCCDSFLCLTCRGHNFFVLTRIWACKVLFESSLNVECKNG